MSRPDFEDISYKIIETFSKNIKRYSSGYTMLLHAIDFIEGPSYEVIIAGKKSNSKQILNLLYNSNQLNKVLIFRRTNKKLNSEFEYLKDYYSSENGKPLVYICKNYVCNLPTSNPELISKQLNE